MRSFRDRVVPLLAGLGVLSALAALSPTGAPAAPVKEFLLGGDVSGLYPGAELPMAVTVTNPLPQVIVVTSVRAATVGSDRGGCDPSLVTSPGWTGSVRVASGGQANVFVAIRMSGSAPGACQGATFTLQLTGTAVRP
jgi:hypothetical protein